MSNIELTRGWLQFGLSDESRKRSCVIARRDSLWACSIFESYPRVVSIECLDGAHELYGAILEDMLRLAGERIVSAWIPLAHLHRATRLGFVEKDAFRDGCILMRFIPEGLDDPTEDEPC